jgi:hypothetical protein
MGRMEVNPANPVHPVQKNGPACQRLPGVQEQDEFQTKKWAWP